MNRLSPNGQDWLTVALDPFHDFQRPVEGLPDQTTQHSFVRCHVQQQTVSAAGEGDKIRVLFTGFHSPFQMSVVAKSSAETGSQAYPFDLWPIQITKSTSALNPDLTSTDMGGFPTTPTQDIPSRLIAIGIEVTDVTQRLYQQGTIGCARVSGASDCVTQYIMLEDPDASQALRPMTPTAIRKPCVPSTRTRCGLIPTYVEWAAYKGLYAVPHLSKPQMPTNFLVGSFDAPADVDIHPIEFRETDAEAHQHKYVTFPIPPTLPEIAQYKITRGGVDSGFDPLAIFIEGIDQNAQFRVSVKTYVEYFPECSNATALASSSPSPAYDPTALALYHEVSTRMPAGVPVSLNEKGDWWRMVSATLRNVGKIADRLLPTVANVTGAVLGQPELGAMAGHAYKFIRPAVIRAYKRGKAKNVPKRK